MVKLDETLCYELERLGFRFPLGSLGCIIDPIVPVTL